MQYTIDDNKLTIGDLIKLQTAKEDIAVMVSILRKCVEIRWNRIWRRITMRFAPWWLHRGNSST